MRRLLALLIFASLVGVAAIALFRWRSQSELPPPVPPGDREVAWIHAATSGSAWERFVAGVHRARYQWPRLTVDDSRAFQDQTTAVPEVVLGVAGSAARIHVRWYKLTSATDSAYWVNRLAERATPPLVFIGGGTSDRAVELARALAAQTQWNGSPPLLFITTATANGVASENDSNREIVGLNQTPLIGLYPGRSFRFCFTNRQMAQAVVDFLWSQPDLRPSGYPVPTLSAIPLGATGAFGSVARLITQSTYPPLAYALYWQDDPYSSDLASQFHEAMHQSNLPPILMLERIGIPYSVGDFFRPNAWEALAADRLLQELRSAPLERRVLVLPTGAAPARRIIRALTSAMPLVGRNLVAIGGDAINLNNINRDGDVVWNIRSLPVPLVFFTHQNPVDWDDTPGSQQLTSARSDDPGVLLPPTATDDVLLHANLVRQLVESAFGTDLSNPTKDAAAEFAENADVLGQRLRQQKPAFFDATGDRLGGRGEYVVSLRPVFDDSAGGAQVMSSAILEVWTRDSSNGDRAPEVTNADAGHSASANSWRLIRRLVIDHARRPDTLP